MDAYDKGYETGQWKAREQLELFGSVVVINLGPRADNYDKGYEHGWNEVAKGNV